MNTKKLIAVFINLLIISQSYAQGWEQIYHRDNDTLDTRQTLEQTPDGGFFIAAGLARGPSTKYDAYLIKTDVNGDTLWTNIIDDFRTTSTVQTTDGGYALAGYSGRHDNFPYNRLRFIKTNANGDTLWSKKYGTYSSANSVIQTTDGGYMLAGSHRTSALLVKKDLYILKTDANGDTLWTKTYAASSQNYDDIAKSVIELSNGYLIAGVTRTVANGWDVYLLRTDMNGDTLWTKTYGGTGNELIESMISTTDGNYVLAGGINNDAYLVKIDGNGTILWNQSYGGTGTEFANSVVQSNDGGFVLAGSSTSFGAGDSDISMIKTNSLGVFEWQKTFGSQDYDNGTDVVLSGNGYALLGYNYVFSFTLEVDVNFIKTDSLGNIYTNYIKGNIFNDTSSNCLKDVGEQNFSGILVEAIGDRTWYGYTDSLGNYCINVDTGSYTVTVAEPTYWQACTNNITVNLPNLYTNDTVNFAFQAQINCPLMYVDLAAPFLRFTSTGSYYTVSYCNNGTIDATNVSVVVEIDPDLHILSTSLPIATQSNNNLTFNIGTVAYGTCGAFTIQVIVDSNSLMHQTHCSEAHIYPDSFCLPNAWTGPIIDATASCFADSITFKLYNVGNSLLNSRSYYVFEDHFIMDISPSGNIPSGDSSTITIPADTGKTYRISIAQDLGYPESTATAAIEGCIPYLNGSFNTGFITQFSNGNSSPFIAVDCQQNITAFDPNDKSAQPEGYQAQHYIYDHTDLDYKIRFQNTGNDTAFLVVVRDTISPLLDLTTLEMGASSHAYTWRIYGARILEVTFSNIMLPDSNVNELASNGFFRYRIEQNPGNLAGAVIYNAADIYFDFNAPIQTNQTYHTIGENFVVVLSNPIIADDKNIIDVKVYPNPFTHSATFEVEGKDYSELQLSIYDLSGREIIQKTGDSNKIELSKGNLNAGVYIYRLLGDDGLINTGKIIVQ